MNGGEGVRKWNMALTYEPKIVGVLSGDVVQTIRVGRKFAVGDVVSFHGWEGRPYHSKWSFRTPYVALVDVCDILMSDAGIEFQKSGAVELGVLVPWSNLDELARCDGIVPPTGAALKAVLMSGVKSKKSIEAQIIRWNGGEI